MILNEETEHPIIKQLQEIESAQSRKEDEQAMKDLSQMYDPETGMFFLGCPPALK